MPAMVVFLFLLSFFFFYIVFLQGFKPLSNSHQSKLLYELATSTQIIINANEIEQHKQQQQQLWTFAKPNRKCAQNFLYFLCCFPSFVKLQKKKITEGCHSLICAHSTHNLDDLYLCDDGDDEENCFLMRWRRPPAPWSEYWFCLLQN